jgi:deazaflavin-dependent oxidoreductase (nitroreductase family)
MTLRTAVTDRFMTTMTHAHRLLVKASGGRLGTTMGPSPVVELNTIGRSSGKRRSAMLAAPVVENGTYVLVASKGGDDRHPFWYTNLLAEPNVEITVDGVTHAMRARAATVEEKAELWPRVVSAYRGYAAYQEKTAREIPVVICEPR